MFQIHSRLALIQTRLELIEQFLHRILALIESLQQQKTATTAHPADCMTSVRVPPQQYVRYGNQKQGVGVVLHRDSNGGGGGSNEGAYTI